MCLWPSQYGCWKPNSVSLKQQSLFWLLRHLSGLLHLLSTDMTVCINMHRFWSAGDKTQGFMYCGPELYQLSKILAPVCIWYAEGEGEEITLWSQWPSRSTTGITWTYKAALVLCRNPDETWWQVFSWNLTSTIPMWKCCLLVLWSCHIHLYFLPLQISCSTHAA